MTAPIDAALIAFADELADAAGEIVRRYFRRGVTVDDKADMSPVTIADREAEAALRVLIERRFPDHGILGEEHGSVRTGAERVWVLDPIDGTKSFISGVPLFGTLIALVEGGVPVLGVIDQPISRERWIGARGHKSARRLARRRCLPPPPTCSGAPTPRPFSASRARSSSRALAAIAMPMACWRQVSWTWSWKRA